MTEESVSIFFPFIFLGNLDRQNIIPATKAALRYIIVIIKILHYNLTWLFSLILFSN